MCARSRTMSCARCWRATTAWSSSGIGAAEAHMTNFESPPQRSPIDVEGPSPLWPRHLADLFLRPRRFFTDQLALGKTPYAVLVAWCYGVSASIDRLDQELIRAELGKPRPGWENLAPYVVDWWPGF